ncbi:MAG: class II aldolase/adducin family protein [Fervidicoccaceae archaeon]
MSNLKKKVADGMKRLYERGLVSSLGGNVSARSEDNSRIFITPSGVPKWEIFEEDVVVVDPEGRIIEGTQKPSSELPSHLLIYRKRDEVHAIVHAHPPYAIALANQGLLVPPLHVSPEEVLYLRRLSVVDFAPPGIKTAEMISEAITSSDVIVMKNHGAFAMGGSIEEAIAKMEILEEASKIIYLQLAIERNPSKISNDNVQEILRTYKKS